MSKIWAREQVAAGGFVPLPTESQEDGLASTQLFTDVGNGGDFFA
jgi:hypothetical protein